MKYEIDVKEISYYQTQTIEASTKEEAEEIAIQNIHDGMGISLSGDVKVMRED